MALHVAHHGLAITVVGILGNIIAVMVYLAPLPTLYRIHKKKSTESFQSLPYVVALFSAMLWLYYAFLKTNEYFLLSINIVGCVIETLYIAFYFAYASRKARNLTAKLVLSLIFGVFSVIVIIIQLVLRDDLTRVEVLGYICATVNISVFAAPLAIMMKVIRTKSVEFMPFPLSFFLTLCGIMWLAYGLLRHDRFVSIPNMCGVVLGLLQMVLYAIWKTCCASEVSQKNTENSSSIVVENMVTGDKNQQRICKPQGEAQMTDQLDTTVEVKS